MIVSQKHKSGVTLMEVMAVVAIMGILSGLGVAGLRSAVANARIKDAAYNVTAFMERTANEARRVNGTLCAKNVDSQKLVVFKSDDCDNIDEENDRFDSLLLESPVQFISSTENNGLTGDNWALEGKVAEFRPRSGLSAAPIEGYFEMQYGGSDRYAAAAKSKNKNSFVPKVKYSGSQSSWSDI